MLLHFSEDPDIPIFAPHVAATAEAHEARVWAIDAAHAPSYWFPRDCPRACCWRGDAPVTARGAALLGAKVRVHAIERAWLARVEACRLYAYSFDAAAFTLADANAGYWIAREAVVPLSVAPVGDLLARHAEAGIDLRVVDDLWPTIDAILASGLAFSIIRKANALPRDQESGK